MWPFKKKQDLVEVYLPPTYSCALCHHVIQATPYKVVTVESRLSGFYNNNMSNEEFCPNCAPEYDAVKHTDLNTYYYRNKVPCDNKGVPLGYIPVVPPSTQATSEKPVSKSRAKVRKSKTPAA